MLVEGSRDVDVLYHVSSLAGFDHLRFLALPGLDAAEKKGGKDSIISYLRRNQGLVQNRPPEAPLLVVFDWDVSKQDLERARKAYGPGGDSRVFKMNADHCDPLLGPDFKGIERLFPPAAVLDAHHAGELVLGVAPGKPYSISKTQLDKAKGRLLERVLSEDKTSELKPLLKVLADIEVAAHGEGAIQISFPGFDDGSS